MWKDLIEEEGINDSDLTQGVKECCKNEKFLPSIGVLIEYCNRIKMVRWADEERKLRAEHNKNNKDLMNSDKATEMGKRSLKLIQLMLTKKIDPVQKVDYVLKMEEFYPGFGWSREAMHLRRDYEDMGLIKE